jgi:hypothetical protein
MVRAVHRRARRTTSGQALFSAPVGEDARGPWRAALPSCDTYLSIAADSVHRSLRQLVGSLNVFHKAVDVPHVQALERTGRQRVVKLLERFRRWRDTRFNFVKDGALH